MYPLQYRLITCADDKITYEAKTVEDIDTEALNAASGHQYSEAMLAAMEAGMNDFAYGYLRTGIQYRLELSLTMEKMGISESDIYYGLVNTAVTRLTDLLEMPLYGENSVQEKAKGYNLVIPDSDYENLWDLAMTLLSMHYAGEENFDLYSTEVTILLRSVSMILKDVLAGTEDDLLFAWAEDYVKSKGGEGLATEVAKLCAQTFGGVTPVEYALCAVASPIIYEFAYDSDGVNDNNGILDGYAVEKDMNLIESIVAWFKSLIAKAELYLRMFFEIFTKTNFI